MAVGTAIQIFFDFAEVIEEEFVFDFQVQESFDHMIAFCEIGHGHKGIAEFHGDYIRTFAQHFHQWKSNDSKVPIKSGFILLHFEWSLYQLIDRVYNFGKFLLYFIFNVHGFI